MRWGVTMAVFVVLAASCSSTREQSISTSLSTPPTAPETSSPTSETTAPPTTDTTAATTTVAATVATAVTTTVAATTTSTTAPSAASRPIAAIDDNGDAVIVALDGTKTVLFDGTDPDDPPPTEGDSTAVSGVVVLDDLSVAFISNCCEPVPGTMFRTVPPAAATYDSGFVGYGDSPTLSPDQTRLVRPVYDQLVVSDLDLNEIATAPIDIGTAFVYQAIFVDPDTVVALTGSGTGSGRLVLYDIAGAALVPGISTDLPAPTSSGAVSLAGSGDGVVYVSGLTPRTLSAFDATTLAAMPAADITLPSQPISAWVQDGEVRWVGEDRVLHVGDAVVPGAFIWVR